MLTFNKRRDFVFEVDFNIPKFDITNEDWVTNEVAYGQTDFNLRSVLNSVTDPAFKSLVDYFFTVDFKNKIVDILYSEPLFAGYWAKSPNEMKSITKTICTPVLDKPGHNTAMHLDSRMLVAAGMCYLINGDDPQQSTIFYTDQHYNNPIRMPTGWGKGWLAANMHDSWHEGFNKSEINRYSILFGLSLDI